MLIATAFLRLRTDLIRSAGFIDGPVGYAIAGAALAHRRFAWARPRQMIASRTATPKGDSPISRPGSAVVRFASRRACADKARRNRSGATSGAESPRLR